MKNTQNELLTKIVEYNLGISLALMQLIGKEKPVYPEEPWVSAKQFEKETDICTASFLCHMPTRYSDLPKEVWKFEKHRYYFKKDALVRYFLNCSSPRMRNKAQKYLAKKEKECKTTNTLPPQPID